MIYQIADFYIKNMGKLTLGVGLIVAASQVIFYTTHKISPDLNGIILKTLAGAGLPVGFGLVICAFDVDLIQKIPNPEVYILVSGISVIYVSILSIFPNLKPDPTQPPDASRPAPPGPRNT
jgi:hypothetical protein